MKLTDVSSIFENSGFKVFASAVQNGGVVKAINAKGFGTASVGQIDTLTKTAVEAGAKGLAYIKVREDDWRSPISKFLSEEEKQKLTETLDIETGDLVLFAAGPWEPSCDILGRVRLQCAEFMELLKDNKERDFLWVIEFPCSAGMRKNSAGRPSIIRSPVPSRKTKKNCSRENSPPTSAPKLTTWYSTARNSAAALSESMNATCNPPCSRPSASRKNRLANNSGTSWTPSASEHPHTAAWLWAWTVWS